MEPAHIAKLKRLHAAGAISTVEFASMADAILHQNGAAPSPPPSPPLRMSGPYGDGSDQAPTPACPWLPLINSNIDNDYLQNLLTNLGVVSALFLTLAASTFGSVSIEDWDTFQQKVAPGWPVCAPYADNLTSPEMFACAKDARDDLLLWFSIWNSLGVALQAGVLGWSFILTLGVSFTNAKRSERGEVVTVNAMFRTEVWLIMFIFGLGVFCTFFGLQKVCRLKVYGYGHSTIFQNSLWIVGSFLAVAGFKTTLAVRTINSQLHERKYSQQSG